ncbi:sugar nucleotide-binding protein [Oribacterium sinus]|uniref:sugar nucleotide-binding protein n=1 Tax=Oribacterium sinus TaxID=237576 RepID=UPI0028D3F0EA|nr:sugar nucleotide-binding protein [Oribacterium sinus]
MKDLLVGCTGFVGGNLKKYHLFEGECHSTDIHEYYGSQPELCVYAGVPSAMYLANSHPEEDLRIIQQAFDNLRQICPRRLVLISTVAVYSNPKKVDEKSVIQLNTLPAYGYNRALLESWVRKEFKDSLVVRLPALYGEGLKKNFLYDLHNIIPAMLQRKKYEELSKDSELVKLSYTSSNYDFYKLCERANIKELREFFNTNAFNALSFTDSRSRYQFYNLKRLWNDLCKLLVTDISLMNLVSPPVSTELIYQSISGKEDWKNKLNGYYDYDVRTLYAEVFGEYKSYIMKEEEEIKDIIDYMKAWKVEEG